ncbi:MAG TPA: LysM peptidoglycan-binding domain-containing protein, partial [Pseudomonas pachastrellae]|nr:LysM peptidoglycan-binding domain-containing protein [Halopseudomonas pachastrellae]
IKRDNNLASNGLTVGDTLILRAAASGGSSNTRRVAYTVRSGDSLYTIAQRFNVDVDKIRDWNQLGRYLQPGQQLTLFVR